jgi:hypothetical protein
MDHADIERAAPTHRFEQRRASFGMVDRELMRRSRHGASRVAVLSSAHPLAPRTATMPSSVVSSHELVPPRAEKRFAAVSHSCLSEELTHARSLDGLQPCLTRVSWSLRDFAEASANSLIDSQLQKVSRETSNVAQKPVVEPRSRNALSRWF